MKTKIRDRYKKPKIKAEQVRINFFSSSFRTTGGDLLAMYCGQCSRCEGCDVGGPPCDVKSC